MLDYNNIEVMRLQLITLRVVSVKNSQEFCASNIMLRHCFLRICISATLCFNKKREQETSTSK